MKKLSRRRHHSAVTSAVIELLDGRVLLDALPPSASAFFSTRPKPGDSSPQQITVEYFDDDGVNASTLDANDVTLTFTPTATASNPSPAPQTVPLTFNGVDPGTDPTSRIETFTFTPLGGAFGAPGTEGSYQLTLNAGQVADNAGNAVNETTLASEKSVPVTIQTTGPITAVSVSADPETAGQLQVLTSLFPQSGQFFGPTSFPGNAGITIRTYDPAGTTPSGSGIRAYGFNNDNFTVESQTASADGRTVTTVVTGGADNNTPFRITQVVTYNPGEQFFTVSNTVQNTGPTAYHFDLFFSSDLYLASSDSGYGFFNPETNAVGGTSPDRQYNIFFQGVPGAIQPTNYEENSFGTITSRAGTLPPADFKNTVLPDTTLGSDGQPRNNIVDNGAGIEWKDQVLQPGASTNLPFFAAFGNVTVATTGPSATVPADLLASTTGGTFSFPVTFADATTVDASTIGTGDIVVTGPNDYSAAATLLSTNLTSGSTVTALFRVDAPQGGFADGGTYSIVFQNGATADLQGNPSAGSTIGSFTASPEGTTGGGGSGTPIVRGPVITIGGLDPNFGGGDGVASVTLANQNARTVGILSQGDKLVVAVTFTPAAGGNSDFELFRLNSDGSLDTTFGNSGFARANFPVNAVGNDVRTTSDGRILFVGTAGSTADGSADLAAARFTADGQLDSSFGNGTGRVVQDLTTVRGLSTPTNDVARTVLLNADNSFFVGGYIATAPGAPGSFLVARFTNAGALDASFANTGVAFATLSGDAAVNALVAIPGKSAGILAVGSDVASGQSQIAAVKFLNNGQTDPKFATRGVFKTLATGANAQGFAAAVQPFDGKIILAGDVAQGSLATPSASLFALVRLTSTGKVDKSFSRDGVVTTSFADLGDPYAAVTSLTVTGGKKDGKILASGKAASSFSTATSRDRAIALARYDLKGNLDAGFGTAGGRAVLLTPDTLGAFGAANDALASAFDAFTADAQGAITTTQGGGIRALASDSNTQNSTVFVAAIVPDGVDLAGTLSQKNPTSVTGGAKGNATVSVRNNGTQTARGRVPITLYASTDQTLSTDDVAITTITTTQNLTPGKTKAQKLNFNFPASLNGQYFLIADINSGTTPSVAEVNLSNNSAATPNKTTVKPSQTDLSGAFVNLPTTLTSGQKVTLTVNVRNESTANTTAKGTVTLNLSQSSDQSVGSDTAIASATGKINLKPGQTKAVKFTLTLPTLPPATAYLLGTLTFNGQPGDANPDNNALFSPLQITFQ